MKDEKELWLNENELMNLLEGKMTWEQIHGKPPGNGSFAKDELNGMKRGSVWEARGNRQAGSAGTQLMPISSNLSRTAQKGEKESHYYMTSCQIPQPSQVLPGPASETEWLNLDNPHLRTLDSNEQNVFFLQRSGSSDQETAVDYLGEQMAAASLSFRGDTARGVAPAISAPHAFAPTSVSGHRLNGSKHRGSLHNAKTEKPTDKSRFFNDDPEWNSFFDIDNRDQNHKKETQLYDSDLVGTFFQRNEMEGPGRNGGFFETEDNNSDFFDSSDTAGYLQHNEPQRTDAFAGSDVPVVSAFSDIADVRRAPFVKIGIHEPAKKQPLALPNSNRPRVLTEGVRNNAEQKSWDNPHSDNLAESPLSDKNKWDPAPADNNVYGMNRGALSGAGLGLIGGRARDLNDTNEGVLPESNRFSKDLQGLSSYQQGLENHVPDVSFDQLNWSKPSIPTSFSAPDQYSPKEHHAEESYREDHNHWDPYKEISYDNSPAYQEQQKTALNQFLPDRYSDDLSPYESEGSQYDPDPKQNDLLENQFEFTVNKYVPTAEKDYSSNQFEASFIDYEDSLVNRIRRDRFSMTSNDTEPEQNRSSYENDNRMPPSDREDRAEQFHRSRYSEDFNPPRNDNNTHANRFASPERFENHERFEEYNSYDTISDRFEDSYDDSQWIHDERQSVPAGTQIQTHNKQSSETPNDRYSAKNKEFALDYEQEEEEYFNGYQEEDAVDKYFSSDRRAVRSSQREARQEMVNLESQYEDYADYNNDEYVKKPSGVFKIITITLIALVVGFGGFLVYQYIF